MSMQSLSTPVDSTVAPSFLKQWAFPSVRLWQKRSILAWNFLPHFTVCMSNPSVYFHPPPPGGAKTLATLSVGCRRSFSSWWRDCPRETLLLAFSSAPGLGTTCLKAECVERREVLINLFAVAGGAVYWAEHRRPRHQVCEFIHWLLKTAQKDCEYARVYVCMCHGAKTLMAFFALVLPCIAQ